jgi:RimJ/RimL family protein N-acetyltransferase
MITPHLREFPDHFSTARLNVRAPQPGDGPETYAAVTESLAELRPWMPWAKEATTVESQEDVMRRAHAEFVARNDLMLLLFLQGTETLVGCSGLHRIDWSVPRFEIGYWVRTPYAGQGLITEAVCGIAAFAFQTLGARRVEIRCDENNTRSARVALRAGFTLEGILRHTRRHHLTGELVNTMIFAQIAGDP